ncbi:MAG: S41 family peptidase [Acidobacteriota bacterium]|nr:S41 family peptidase [Acidobacteriota bacterium]
MKNQFKKVSLSGLLALALALGLVVPSLVSAQQEPMARRISEDYQKAADIISKYHFADIDDEAMSKAAISGMLKTLDPHSDYLDPKAFREFSEKQQSQYFGIGAMIGTRHKVTYVLEPFKGSPASRAGLRYGDHIVAVDGKDTSDWGSDKVRQLLLGERGTQINVTVKRLGVTEPIKVAITRDGIPRPSVRSFYMVKPGIGYIGLTEGFQATTSREVAVAIANLREQGAESFVLDLRGNGGGYLDQGVRVCDQLLQRGQRIVSQKGRPGLGFDEEYFVRIGASDNFPLVVLVDRQTASASEIVAGAIQDHDRGLIIGEQTFGKGLVQRIFPLVNSGGLIMTIAHYYTPSGRLIQRDYSNGSLFEYYYRRSAGGDALNAPPKRTEERKTDLGRTVYGGGGIEPDEKLESTEYMTPAQLRLSHGIYLFARDLVAGQVPSAANFKVNGLEYDHKLKPTDFVINDAILKAQRDFLVKFYKDNSEYGLTTAAIDENSKWLHRQLRYEVLTAAYGSDRAQQGIADWDAILQKGITEMPKAADLATRSWKRSSATSRQGGK